MVPLTTMRTAVGQRDQPLVDDLVFFRLGLTLAQAGGQVDGHGLGHESGAGVELQNAAPLGGGVSSLFQQFALGGLQFLLTGVDASGGEFPQIAASGVAILSFEQDARRLRASRRPPVRRRSRSDG